MGGCRCTYRKCTVRSDGQTHMFHYPVFDKVRCHQWLTNAQCLHFLNLKLCQLRNRVVCQHHFRDDQFMNYKKNKLTFDAIPTEDGPYCDSKNEFYTPDVSKMYPITLEDIENDQLTLNEKRANFSVKYGDFLTNSELIIEVPMNMNMDSGVFLNNQMNNGQNVEEEANNFNNSGSNVNVFTHKVSLPPESSKKHQTQPMLVVPPYSDNNNLLTNPSLDNIFYESEADRTDMINREAKSSDKTSVKVPNKESVTKRNKITIISEKKISEPLSLKGKLEPVSPSIIIHPHKKKSETNIQLDRKIKMEKECIQNNQIIEIELSRPNNEANNITYQEPNALEKNEDNVKIFQPSQQINKSGCQSNASILKNKIITPERVAAIQEKRKFNKKLRDMIEFCLDELEETEKTSDEKGKIVNKVDTKLAEGNKLEGNTSICLNDAGGVKTKTIKVLQKAPQKTRFNIMDNTNNGEENVGSFLSKETSLPSISEYTIASLEDRLKKMEYNLLKKIEENSQRIIDLKNSVAKSPKDCSEKKTVLTQTTQSEEIYKKQLFQEISQFLSPSANSLLYEELFINKYSKTSLNSATSSTSNSKLRKRQRYR